MVIHRTVAQTAAVVDAPGRTFLNDEPLIIPALRQKLDQSKSVEPDPAVVVKAADNVGYQNIIDMLDLLRQLNITKVGLATRGREENP